MNKISNKKGVNTSQLLSVIIAMIGILLLAYGVFKIIDTFKSDEYKSAEKVIDIIDRKIKYLDNGEYTLATIQNPCKDDPSNCAWEIQGFSKEDEDRPDRCFFSSCICICQSRGKYEISSLDASLICQNKEKGICKKVDNEKVITERLVRGDGEIETKILKE